MKDPIDKYVATLRHELAGVPSSEDVLSEMEDHLRETSDALLATGCPPQLANREAVQRFGRPGLVARSVRAAHRRPSDRDPAPARRWVFTLTESLLVLASLSALAAIYLHWLPCGGDAITAGRIANACLSRMDTAWAFPFAPEAGERGLVTDILRLTALLSLALGWSALTFGQPWRPLVRLTVALPIVPLLAMAADTAWLMIHPAAEPHWWAYAAASAMDLTAAAAFFALLMLAAPLDVRVGLGPRSSSHAASISYGSFRWRAALLLVGVSATSYLRTTPESIVLFFSDLNWDTPPGTGYLTAGSIAVCAIGSLFAGRFARRPQAFEESTAPANPDVSGWAISGGAR